MPILNYLDILSDISKVISALKALKSGEAPYSDGIPPELLKLGIPCLIVEIHLVMSSFWWEGFIPQDIKEAKLVTLFKNKVLWHDCNNYYSVSLCSLVGKLSRRVILKQIQKLADRIPPKSQYGFGKNVNEQ